MFVHIAVISIGNKSKLEAPIKIKIMFIDLIDSLCAAHVPALNACWSGNKLHLQPVTSVTIFRKHG